MLDKNIPPRRRGRPPGSKNRKPAREHSTWAIRDVPVGVETKVYLIAKETGLTQGEVVGAAVEEYWAARQAGRNKNVEQKYAEIRRIMSASISDPVLRAQVEKECAEADARREVRRRDHEAFLASIRGGRDS